MKLFASVFIALTALAAVPVTAPAQVPQTPTAANIKMGKISPQFTPTPEYTVRGPGEKRAPSQKWLEIEVEFDVDKIEIIDELTFKYYVSFNGKLYTGEVTHVNIPKGKDHYSVMYMSPRSVDRAAAGHPVNAAMLDNIWVTVEKQGVKLGSTAINAAKPIPNIQQVPGMLVQKSETPFAPLWWDRYEAVKAPAH